MDNKTLILSEFERHKGEFVISDNKVYRLIAIGQDDMDYYYIYFDGKKTIWSTCVGSFIPLKNKIDDRHYANLIRVAKLNHLDQPTVFGTNEPHDKVISAIESFRHSIEVLPEPDKYLTDICWDIN